MLQEMLDFLRTRGKMTLLLAAVNIVTFAVLSVLGSTEDVRFMLRCGACYTPLIAEGGYYRLVTAMFLHFGLMHLLYNMICLIAMGDLLEKEIGVARFLLIYFAGGVAGNLCSLWMDLFFRNEYAVSAGASGAVFAVIGALLRIVLRRNRQKSRTPADVISGEGAPDGTLNSISVRRMIVSVGLMVFQGFTEAGTDNAAHVGGLAVGFLLGGIFSAV